MSRDEPFTDEERERINKMTHEELARSLRFDPPGSPQWQGLRGQYRMERFKSLGGMTPEMSKRIGWDR